MKVAQNSAILEDFEMVETMTTFPLVQTMIDYLAKKYKNFKN